MTKAELKDELEQALQNFVDECKFVASDPYSKEPVTQGDLYESHKQVFYLLDRFKDALLNYLD